MEALNSSTISQVSIFKSSNIVLLDAILPAILIVLNGKIDRIHQYQNESDAERILNVRIVNHCFTNFLILITIRSFLFLILIFLINFFSYLFYYIIFISVIPFFLLLELQWDCLRFWIISFNAGDN